jgi:hypothetical protein
MLKRLLPHAPSLRHLDVMSDTMLIGDDALGIIARCDAAPLLERVRISDGGA